MFNLIILFQVGHACEPTRRTTTATFIVLRVFMQSGQWQLVTERTLVGLGSILTSFQTKNFLFVVSFLNRFRSRSVCLAARSTKPTFHSRWVIILFLVYSAWACWLAGCEESACFHLVRSLFGITAAVLRGSSAEKCETPVREFVLNLLSITVQETSFKGAVVQRRFEHVFHFCLTR